MSLKVHRRGTGAISSSKLQCRSLWSHFLCLCASTARSWGQWEVLLFSFSLSLCLFASFSHWPVLRTHVTVRRAVTFIQFHEPALRSALFFFFLFKKKLYFNWKGVAIVKLTRRYAKNEAGRRREEKEITADRKDSLEKYIEMRSEKSFSFPIEWIRIRSFP